MFVTMPPRVRPQVLNDAFQSAANEARQKLPELTSNQKVSFYFYECVEMSTNSTDQRKRGNGGKEGSGKGMDVNIIPSIIMCDHMGCLWHDFVTQRDEMVFESANSPSRPISFPLSCTAHFHISGCSLVPPFIKDTIQLGCGSGSVY